MTVTYSLQCSNNRFGNFIRLLFRWEGSVYKILYKDLIIFLILYFILSIIYRFALDPDQYVILEKIIEFCEVGVDMIPLTFVLGFFVTLVVDRWWNNFLAIPWPDRAAIKISCLIPGSDERSRMIRRTIVRHIILATTILLRDISSTVKKRFPSDQHLLNAGLITDDELDQFRDAQLANPSVTIFWMPVLWSINLLSKARDENRIKSDFNFRSLHKELLKIRNSLGSLSCNDWITIPLVYTQVITIAVYGFFLFCVVARQFVRTKVASVTEVDMIFPFFSLLQVFFYMGWLKVAEVLMNPFGEDDEDFELNYLIERHLRVSFTIVDDLCNKLPPLVRDAHWQDSTFILPDTKASLGLKCNPLVGSATNYKVPERLQSIVEETENAESKNAVLKLRRNTLIA